MFDHELIIAFNLNCIHIYTALRKKLSSYNLFNFNNTSILEFCWVCQYGKMHKLHLNSTSIKSVIPFELIHSELWGLAPLLSNQGHWYYVAFINDYSRFTWIYRLTTKSETIRAFITFKKEMVNHFNTRIKEFQCDIGGEYKSIENLLKEKGIKMRYSCPYTHNQNGIAKKKHRHLVEKASHYFLKLECHSNTSGKHLVQQYM